MHIPWQSCSQLISQVSASEGDELELIVQGLCAFLLGICVIFNSDQVPSYHRYIFPRAAKQLMLRDLFVWREGQN